MKLMILGVLTISLPAMAQSTVDFQKLGVIAEALSAATIQGDNQVVYAQPKFDLALSSLEKDRIVYSMTGEVKTSRWGSNVVVAGSTDYSIDRSSSHQGGVIGFNTQKTTDVLAMFRFASQTAFDKAESLAEKAPIAKALLKGANVQSMNDLYGALDLSKAVALNEIDRQIAEGYSNKAELEKTKEAFQSVSFSMNPAGTELSMVVGKPANLLATAPSYDIRAAKVSSLTVTFSATRITSSGGIFVPLSDDQIAHLHRRYVKEFNALIARDSETEEFYQSQFRKALIAFKDVLNMANVR